jgi:hypothetical protein
MRQVPRESQERREVNPFSLAIAISLCLWIIILKAFGII